MESSAILEEEAHRKIVEDFVGEVDKIKKFKLLFTASKDGEDAASFHRKCDNKGPTLTIVKSI